MADKKISELNSIAQVNLLSTDLVVVARAGDETFKITVAELDKRYSENPVKYFGDPDTNGTWRIRASGADLLIEVRVAGTYIPKKEYSI